jgi:drug/metabolite transporter (DMT)-like permease
MDRRSWILLTALAAVWGASFLFVEIGLRELSPIWVAWGRTVLAALVLLPIALHQGSLRGLRAHWRMILVLSVVQMVLPFTLIAWGQEEVPSALAAILIASAPLFTAVLAIWVDHEERSQGIRMVGLLIGFAGVIALLGLDLSGSAATLIAGFVILIGGVAYATGGFILKHGLPGLSPLGVLTAVMVTAAIIMVPLAAVSAPGEVPSAGPVAAVAALGLFGTGAGLLVFYRLIRKIGPGKAIIVSYLVPGYAVVYGAVLLDEAITLGTLAGLALIVAGSWLAAEGGLRRWRGIGDAPAVVDVVGGIAPGEAAATAPAITRIEPRQ